MMKNNKVKYKVLNGKNEVIMQGNLLGELIESIILKTLNYLEKNKSLIFKIENGYYNYFDVLSTIFKNCNYFEWENVDYIEMVHNNEKFLKQEHFVKIKKQIELKRNSNKRKLTYGENKN